MRLLFEIDTADYDPNGIPFIRHSARCIAIRNGSVAMVHSAKYNYYKFPGGGIERGETGGQALIRETREEAGLTVIPHSVKPYGYVHRVQKSSDPNSDYFVQDNFYYLCDVEPDPVPQGLDDYEADEGFELAWVAPELAITVNRTADHGPTNQTMLEREARVLALLQEEGYFA